MNRGSVSPCHARHVVTPRLPFKTLKTLRSRLDFASDSTHVMFKVGHSGSHPDRPSNKVDCGQRSGLVCVVANVQNAFSDVARQPGRLRHRQGNE